MSWTRKKRNKALLFSSSLAITGGLAGIIASTLSNGESSIIKANDSRIQEMNKRTDEIMNKAGYEAQTEIAKEEGEEFNTKINEIKKKGKTDEEILKCYYYKC